MLFPAVAPRGLSLSPPLPHDQKGIGDGHDVSDIQKACNIWASQHNLPQCTVDGQYGPETDNEIAMVAYDMGLKYFRAMRPTLTLIYHKWMRTPADLLREKQRRAHPIATPQQKALAWEQSLAQQHFTAPNDRNPVLQGWEVDEGVGAQPGSPWCQYFQNEAWHRATGRRLPDWFLNGEPGYTPWVLDQARAGRGGLRTCPPQPGCWIFFSWGGTSTPDHVGMVIDIGARRTVEGNTGSTYGEHAVAIHQGAEHWPYACGFVWPWDMH